MHEIAFRDLDQLKFNYARWLPTHLAERRSMQGLSRNCPIDHNFVISEDVCSSHPCQNNGKCQVDKPEKYFCSCLQGTSGPHCEGGKLHICILVLMSRILIYKHFMTYCWIWWCHTLQQGLGTISMLKPRHKMTIFLSSSLGFSTFQLTFVRHFHVKIEDHMILIK